VYAAKKEIVEHLDVHPDGEYIGDEALITKLGQIQGKIQCNPPDHSLYSWAGSFWLGQVTATKLTPQTNTRPSPARAHPGTNYIACVGWARDRRSSATS